jgi:hypothetical protein
MDSSRTSRNSARVLLWMGLKRQHGYFDIWINVNFHASPSFCHARLACQTNLTNSPAPSLSCGQSGCNENARLLLIHSFVNSTSAESRICSWILAQQPSVYTPSTTCILALKIFLIFSRTDAANATENIPNQSVCISCVLNKFTGALTF